MMEKFVKYATKMTPLTFEKFLQINAVLNWKKEFTFFNSFNPNSNSCEFEYWWVHRDGAKSGEVFETMDEAELSALIFFSKKWDGCNF